MPELISGVFVLFYHRSVKMSADVSFKKIFFSDEAVLFSLAVPEYEYYSTAKGNISATIDKQEATEVDQCFGIYQTSGEDSSLMYLSYKIPLSRVTEVRLQGEGNI